MKLRELMEKAGIQSIRELAKTSGVAASTLSRIMNKGALGTKHSTLEKISKALNVSTDDLYNMTDYTCTNVSSERLDEIVEEIKDMGQDKEENDLVFNIPDSSSTFATPEYYVDKYLFAVADKFHIRSIVIRYMVKHFNIFEGLVKYDDANHWAELLSISSGLRYDKRNNSISGVYNNEPVYFKLTNELLEALKPVHEYLSTSKNLSKLKLSYKGPSTYPKAIPVQRGTIPESSGNEEKFIKDDKIVFDMSYITGTHYSTMGHILRRNYVNMYLSKVANKFNTNFDVVKYIAIHQDTYKDSICEFGPDLSYDKELNCVIGSYRDNVVYLKITDEFTDLIKPVYKFMKVKKVRKEIMNMINPYCGITRLRPDYLVGDIQTHTKLINKAIDPSKPKYELIPDDEIVGCFRIKALQEFDIYMNYVKIGDIGGIVTSESILSQSDNSWIDYNSAVLNKYSKVCDNSFIAGSVIKHLAGISMSYISETTITGSFDTIHSCVTINKCKIISGWISPSSNNITINGVSISGATIARGATINSYKDIMVISHINGTLTAYKSNDDIKIIFYGCIRPYSLKNFKEYVKDKYANDPKLLKEYLNAVKLIKSHMKA